MDFHDFPSFGHTFSDKIVSFCVFRVFGGALPCSAWPRTRPLQSCVLCGTRILHILHPGSFFSRSHTADHSHTHLHFPFRIADSHARTPKTLFLQAFTIGFEVLDFAFSPCRKRRVSVFRCFWSGAFLVSWFPFVGGMKVQVGNSSHVSTHGSSFYTGRREVQLQFNPVQFSFHGTFVHLINWSTIHSFTFIPMESDNAKTISRKSTFSV